MRARAIASVSKSANRADFLATICDGGFRVSGDKTTSGEFTASDVTLGYIGAGRIKKWR
jgi:hypothetical protein